MARKPKQPKPKKRHVLFPHAPPRSRSQIDRMDDADVIARGSLPTNNELDDVLESFGYPRRGQIE